MPKATPKNRIREFRQKKDLSQNALARLLKTSQQQVHRWENGQAINFEMAVVLSKVLGQKADVVFPAFKKISVRKEALRNAKNQADVVKKAIEKAGFETKLSVRWHVRFELKGFKDPFIYSIDVEAAQDIRRFLLNSNSDDDVYNFKLFETGDGLSIAVKTTELTCCQILYDYVSPMHEILIQKDDSAEETPRPDNDDPEELGGESDVQCLRIFTVNNDKIYAMTDLDPEELGNFMADLDNGWYRDNPYSRLTDEDGEDFLIRNEHIALVEVPYDWYGEDAEDEK